ncbi:putative transcription factor bHLH family [Helianthus annuus]|nr:putative transcription factor bHLH family [Helianthus annuus]
MDDSVWSWTQNGIANQFSDSDHGGGGGGSSVGDGERVDGKVESASKNHSEAEKRRRDRINSHLSTLRKLVCSPEKRQISIVTAVGSDSTGFLLVVFTNFHYFFPNHTRCTLIFSIFFESNGFLGTQGTMLNPPLCTQMDKARLLGMVIEQVKQLNSETKELSKVLTIPTHLDEVIIDLDLNTMEPNSDVFIRASVCCEDRAELFSEIKHALKSLRLTVVQADMTSLGGRIVCNFILCVTNNNTNKEEITTLKESLKLLLGRIVASSSSWTMSSHYRIKSKRQRFFCSPNYDTGRS